LWRAVVLQQIAAKNRAEAKRNKEKRKSERDTYLEEMRKAFKLLQIKYVCCVLFIVIPSIPPRSVHWYPQDSAAWP
jgi:hypothetical protein